jgi:hypothetical protein
MSGTPTSNGSFSTHPLVTQLQATKGGPFQVAITGYIGPSEVAGAIRVYTTLNLDHYYDIEQGDVLFASQVDPANPEGPSRVFVDSSTRLREVSLMRREVEANVISLEAKLAEVNAASVFVSCRCMCGHVRPCIGDHD